MSVREKKHYIEAVKKLIEKKENWNDFKSWTHYNFEKLQNNIYTATKVNINNLTLKRFWGKYSKGKDYKSHISTKDTIAQYLGYKDWDNFKKEKEYDEKNPTPATKKSFLFHFFIIKKHIL